MSYGQNKQRGARMPALTLREPWATAVTWLGKRIENRGWTPPAVLQNTRLAIHSAKGFRAEEARAVSELAHDFQAEGIELPLGAEGYPTGAIVATVQVVGFVDLRPDREGGPLIAAPDGVTVEQVQDDRWFVGDVGWLLADVRPLRRPVPCRGAQRLWTVPQQVAELVRMLELDPVGWAPMHPPVFRLCGDCAGPECHLCAGWGKVQVEPARPCSSATDEDAAG